MSNRIDLAKQLLRDGEYTIAKQMLEKESADPQALYLLSLLYRYDDEYDQEKTVVDKALVMDGNNPYMQERLSWHNLPIFDRVVPRQPLHLPRDPKTIPSAEVLENMCFVTGADSKYFQLMVECIESIKATQLYKDVPICVLDCGLTEEEKEYLTTKLKIKEIKDMATVCPEIQDGFLKNIFMRSQLDKLFPGYRYYFFIDADAWIYNENSIDTYINYATQYGIGIAKDLCASEHGKFYGFFGCNPNIIASSLWNEELIKKAPAINAGIYCLDVQSSLCKKWTENVHANIQERGLQTFTDQSALSLALGALNIDAVLSPSNNYFYPVKPAYLENNLFYSIDSKELLGCIHAAGGSGQQVKYTYYQKTAVQKDGTEVKVSYRYRVWPWKDKAQVRESIFFNI
jgi:hypothetical protein